MNPGLPLETLLPLVCDKCEFQLETTVLLKDRESREPLDLSKSLNQHGLREVFAKDLNRRQPSKDRARKCGMIGGEDQSDCSCSYSAACVLSAAPTEVVSPPLHRAAGPKREKKQKENSGFFSLFRRRKKKQDVVGSQKYRSGFTAEFLQVWFHLCPNRTEQRALRLLLDSASRWMSASRRGGRHRRHQWVHHRVSPATSAAAT